MHQGKKGGNNECKVNLLPFPPLPPLSRHINKLLKAESCNNTRED